jgi:hypothetical protein
MDLRRLSRKSGFLKIGKPGSAAFENAVKTAQKRRNLKGLLPTPLGLAGVARLRR